MKVTLNHFHLFCGSGGGALGFNQADARVGSLEADFQCIGGIDVDPNAIADFTRLTGVDGTVMDLFSKEQYTRFHGKAPPPGWREATAQDIQRAAQNHSPNIVFTSAPCKGFSGLLAKSKADSDKYQALNELTVRGFFLTLEAFKDDPPEFIIMENVPRIESRGGPLLDWIEALLNYFGYAVARTTHDCGEIGGLAQSRRRFLMVARHVEKVPPFLYEPTKRPLQSVGRVLEQFPLPGCPSAGPMHSLAKLQFKTWLRLAFVEPGSDWRSLERLQVKDGVLSDYLLMPKNYGFSTVLGVNCWDQHVGAISGRSSASTGAYSVADPRLNDSKFLPHFKIVARDEQAQGVELQTIADVRSKLAKVNGGAYQSARHYGVLNWDDFSGAVTSSCRHDNGAWSVADPRLPSPELRTRTIIESVSGHWHRPFTTLELAALQGLVSPDDTPLTLAGNSHAQWRERIGNMVPPKSATGIAEVMGKTLLLNFSEQTQLIAQTPVWVRPIAVGLSLASKSY
ncbi:DNA cytosine methyltransferase [Pseudoalteromonas luteoviolacea]|uniref:DNA cytosine methyltransferase n=1 Tax=Pseudoalteromonas luteoviolacea TaxID=43657 RepID=UPI001B374DD7|nr:DNA cytosine methyltransferase [Pseudoalteromonas luteoviolacea]MBQ4839789.1 DNA cytosine methyltransferase [Pseudoalteromonas luteoviolacea]